MSILEASVIAVYGLCLAFIFCYSMAQLHLTILYWLHRKRRNAQFKQEHTLVREWPKVTVQLPLYNERYVAARLIDAIAALDYPTAQLQIQVLDDSTDETKAIVQDKLKAYPHLTIQHIRRPNREGFKAGALQYGLQTSTGEFIAVFDADFVPSPDFLKRTVSGFTDARIGVVQTRWGHLNKHYSLLTKLQAFGLDAHFTVEQSGRNSGGHFINFNGTAGVWRKACILEAGGWQADTLTEDLDLSYRAQLKGWKFVFMEDVEAPAELPAAMGALKSQQFRWTKGAAENARKHLLRVLKSGAPFSTKLHATFHLFNSFVFICVFLTALLSVPILFIRENNPQLDTFFRLGAVLLLSLLALVAFYWTALYTQSRKPWATTRRFVPDFFLFLCMSMGLSLHNSMAVAEGLLGKKTPFIRTPKYNLQNTQGTWRKQAYFMPSINAVTLLEGMLMLYFFSGIILALRFNDYGLLPFLVMLVIGFGAVFTYSLFHGRRT